MTPEEHNKYLGIAHVVYGVLHIFLSVVTGAFVLGMMGMMTFNGSRSSGPPPAFMAVVLAFVIVINLLLAIPSFIAGYAFLKRKSWAKIAGIIAAALSALRIPFGTAVSIYTFWFLFSTPGRVLYCSGLTACAARGLERSWTSAPDRELRAAGIAARLAVSHP